MWWFVKLLDSARVALGFTYDKTFFSFIFEQGKGKLTFFFFWVGDHEDLLLLVLLSGLLQKHFFNFWVFEMERKTYRYLLPEARPVVGSSRAYPQGVPRERSASRTRPCPSRTRTPILPPPPSPYGKAGCSSVLYVQRCFLLVESERKCRSVFRLYRSVLHYLWSTWKTSKNSWFLKNCKGYTL